MNQRIAELLGHRFKSPLEFDAPGGKRGGTHELDGDILAIILDLKASILNLLNQVLVQLGCGLPLFRGAFYLLPRLLQHLSPFGRYHQR